MLDTTLYDLAEEAIHKLSDRIKLSKEKHNNTEYVVLTLNNEVIFKRENESFDEDTMEGMEDAHYALQDINEIINNRWRK